MDRFKFRVWDKQQKKYENIPKLINQKGELVSFVVRDDLSKFYDIEQCTGLKDKNGKLIYEGDICRIKGTYYDCDYQEYLEVDDNEKVESLEKFFGEAMLKGVYSALGCDTLQVEVIGNINENADLLEI
jgi:uncharacterized phage protein (TIGR01671 family)